MRRRTIAALVILGAIASVITVHAFTATPPPPYVRLAGEPAPPTAIYSCDAYGLMVLHYTTSDGVPLQPIPTETACAGLGPTTPVQSADCPASVCVVPGRVDLQASAAARDEERYSRLAPPVQP